MAKRKFTGSNIVLDIGTRCFRLLRLSSPPQPGSISIENCWSSDAPHELVVSTFIEYPIMDSAPIRAAIATLLAMAKVPGASGVLLLPDHAALINLMIGPPRSSETERRDAIREELSPAMSLPYEYWHLFYQTIGAWEDQEITLAVAVIRENLLEIGGIVQQTGLNPETIDVNFFCVANLIEHYLVSDESKGKNIGLVHLGNETTSIGVFKDGNLKTFLNRPIGGYDFTKQISKHFHATEKDADELKRNEPFFLPEPSPEQENLYNYSVIRTTFTSMVREIFGALESYLTHFREFNIHEVIISGGGANFQNISVLLGQNLNTTVRCVADLYDLRISGSPADASDRNSLAAACGAFFRN